MPPQDAIFLEADQEDERHRQKDEEDEKGFCDIL
jgi:hypothetical protein